MSDNELFKTLLKAAERCRAVQRQRDADEMEYSASGMTYSHNELIDAEMGLDDAIERVKEGLNDER